MNLTKKMGAVVLGVVALAFAVAVTAAQAGEMKVGRNKIKIAPLQGATKMRTGVTAMPCPMSYGSPDSVAIYLMGDDVLRRSDSPVAAFASRSGYIYYFNEAGRLLATDGARDSEIADLRAYGANRGTPVVFANFDNRSLFYFTGWDGRNWEGGVYVYDSEDRSVNLVLSAYFDNDADSELDYPSGYSYNIHDIDVHNGKLYLLVESTGLSPQVKQIRQISLSQLPADVEDSTVLKNGGINLSYGFAVGSDGIYYVADGSGGVGIRLLSADGRSDVAVMGGGTENPPNPPWSVGAMDMRHVSANALALNRCGDLFVAVGNQWLIVMKPKYSNEVFGVYSADYRTYGPSRQFDAPASLIFDTDDNLYAVMCTYSAGRGPCNLMKFRPITTP